MPRFSANLGFLWPGLPLLERIAHAGAAGFRAVELHWPYEIPAEKVRRACDRAGVRLLCLNTPLGDAGAGDFGLGAIPGREAEFLAGVDQAIAYAAAAGAGAVHCVLGVPPPGDRSAATATAVANLSEACDRARGQGLDIYIETVCPQAREGYFISRLEEAAALADAVGKGNLRLIFDVYHVASAQGDVLGNLQRYIDRIGHIQIASVPDRAEPDRGEIAYRAVFAAIDRLNFRGWIGCEYHPRGDTGTGLGWVRELGVSLGADF